MDIETAISIIRRQRQAFAFGIEGIQTLYIHGTERTEPMQPLRTKVVDELPFSAFLLPNRRQLNSPLKWATANQLAIQLIIGIAEPVKNTPYGEAWEDHESATIRFLRRVRNAAAHGNEIEYRNSFPRPDTVWRGFQFTHEMEGEPLFSQPAEFTWEAEDVKMVEGYFESGDAFVLTEDILRELVNESDSCEESDIVELF